MTSYVTYRPRQAAGSWVIGGNFFVQVRERPNWLHRWFALAFLGWQWVDA
ncbi:hypothetical protein [Stenotrophomonas maltophilia]|nr:hypothetical protein [Stenotrophomonas maltophilia]